MLLMLNAVRLFIFLGASLFVFLYFLPNVQAATPGKPGVGSDTFQIEQPAGQFGVRVDAKNQSAEGVVGLIVKNVISIIYAIASIGVLIMFIWGAVEWIFSGGDKEKVGAARKRITNALIGLVLLSLSYVILSVFGRLINFDIFQPFQIPGLGQGINPPA